MTLTQHRTVFVLLSLLLIASLALALVPVIQHLSGEAGDPEQLSAVATTKPSVQGRTDLTPVLALAPFGAAKLPPSAEPQETSLGLALLGVLISDPPSRSTAIIAATDGVPHAYDVGDAIASGVVLEAVFPNSVTLTVSGQEETLTFPKEDVPPVPPSSAGVDAIRATIPESAGGGLGRKSADAGEDTGANAEAYPGRVASDSQTAINQADPAGTSSEPWSRGYW